MKAIVWKELRENAKWAALGLLAMLIFTVALLYEATNQQNVRNDFVSGEIIVLFVFASCIAAPVIAFLQNPLEFRRDQWAFLIHRGVSATHIFLGKAIAGLTLYMIVMLVPLLLATLFCVWRSPEHMVFDWRTTLPILAEILAGAGLYFATVLVSMRQARWYGSRLLPIALPGLTMLAMPAYMSDFSQTTPPGMFVLIALSVAVSGLAAWGAFIRSGESLHWPKLSKIALGISLSAAYLLAAAFLVGAFVGLVYDYLESKPSDDSSFYDYSIAANGHVIRAEYRNRQTLGSQIEDPAPRFVDMDDPEAEVTQKRAAPPMAKILYRPNSNPGQLPLFGPARGPLVQNLNSVDRLQWRFSTTKGLMYLYTSRVRDPASDTWLPPQLKWIVGRDGFVAPPEQPKLPFGERLTAAAVSSWRYGNNWGGGPPDGDTRTSQYLFFDDGMYEIDPKALTVRQLYAAPDGKQIRSIADLPDGRIALVFDDAIHFHRPNPSIITFGRPEEADSQVKRAMRLTLPGEFIYSIPIPQAVRAFDQFQVTRIPDDSQGGFRLPQNGRDSDQLQAANAAALPAAEAPADGLVVFRGNISPLTSDITRIVTMKTDGEVLQSRDFPNWPPRGLIRQSTPAACAISAAVPLAFACIGAVLDAIVQTWNGTGPGLLLRLVAHDPLAILPGLLSLLAMSTLSVVFARRTARRYGFGRRERRLWLTMAFLFGPTGLLSLYGLRNWPARLPCHMCGEPRAVDLDVCPICASGPEPVPRDGTEIITTPAVTVA